MRLKGFMKGGVMTEGLWGISGAKEFSRRFLNMYIDTKSLGLRNSVGLQDFL